MTTCPHTSGSTIVGEATPKIVIKMKTREIRIAKIFEVEKGNTSRISLPSMGYRIQGWYDRGHKYRRRFLTTRPHTSGSTIVDEATPRNVRGGERKHKSLKPAFDGISYSRLVRRTQTRKYCRRFLTTRPHTSSTIVDEAKPKRVGTTNEEK